MASVNKFNAFVNDLASTVIGTQLRMENRACIALRHHT